MCNVVVVEVGIIEVCSRVLYHIHSCSLVVPVLQT